LADCGSRRPSSPTLAKLGRSHAAWAQFSAARRQKARIQEQLALVERQLTADEQQGRHRWQTSQWQRFRLRGCRSPQALAMIVPWSKKRSSSHQMSAAKESYGAPISFRMASTTVFGEKSTLRKTRVAPSRRTWSARGPSSNVIATKIGVAEFTVLGFIVRISRSISAMSQPLSVVVLSPLFSVS